MKRGVLIFLLLLLPLVAAQDLTDFESLWLRASLNNSLKISHSSDSYSIQELMALLAWFPRANFQSDVQYVTTDPKGDFLSDGLRFKWQYPSQERLSLSWQSQLNITRKFVPVYGKVSFPLSGLDPGLGDFLLPQEIIDSSKEISDLAASLSEGEDDLFVVVFKLGEWVRSHVTYNLSTLTADASQKASWVLQNRVGVCDEITSLFIALARSLGIPARFVAGISYTNIPGIGWGPHGWAEVFFPGYGWIPFDVTYGELGFLDAGHIKLDDSEDAKKSTITYTAKGQNINVASESIGWNIEVLEKGRLSQDLLDLSLRPYAEKTGFGSYNLLTLEVENKVNYYVASRFTLYKTEGLEVMGEREKGLLLKPREKKKLYWVVKVEDDLKDDYAYTFPIRVDSTWGGARNAGFVAQSGEQLLPAGLFTSLVSAEEEALKKPYSKIVDFSCSPNKELVRLEEEIIVFCNVSNLGDSVLRSVRLCLENDCQLLNVGAGGVESTSFVKAFDSGLTSVMVVKAENANITKTVFVRVNVLAEPKVNITLTAVPRVVEFDKKASLKFTVGRASREIPKNVTVSVVYKYGDSSWSLNELPGMYEFDLDLHGSKLDLENIFNIRVSFMDDFGELHSEERSFTVKLINLNVPQQIQVYTTRLAFWLDKMFRRVF